MSLADQVMARDGYKCVECGISNVDHKALYKNSLALHRKNPVGPYTLKNCITLCCVCHAYKPKTRNPPWIYTDRPVEFSLSDEDIMRIDVVRIYLREKAAQRVSRETAIMEAIHAFIQRKGLMR